MISERLSTFFFAFKRHFSLKYLKLVYTHRDVICSPSMESIIALDIGEKRTGIAYCDVSTGVPVALDTIEGILDQGSKLVIAEAKKRGVSRIVIGLPLLPSGEEGSQCQVSRRVGEELAKEGLTVEYIDERYTTPRHTQGDSDATSALQILDIYMHKPSVTPDTNSKEERIAFQKVLLLLMIVPWILLPLSIVLPLKNEKANSTFVIVQLFFISLFTSLAAGLVGSIQERKLSKKNAYKRTFIFHILLTINAFISVVIWSILIIING